MDKKRCIRCRVMFQPKRRTARYCGSKCASAERSKRYRARKDPTPLIATKIECAFCKKEVLVLADNSGSERQYCGTDCRKNAEKLVSKA